jgi:hypothetical protein
MGRTPDGRRIVQNGKGVFVLSFRLEREEEEGEKRWRGDVRS